MTRIRTRLFVLFALLTATACGTLGGQSEKATTLSRVLETGVLRVGMAGDQPPFNMTTKSGEIIGLEADLARALAETVGVKAELVKRPFGELLGALEAGDVDMIISQMAMTPQRNTRVAFAGPYYISGKGILTRSQSLAAADETADIDRAGLRIAALAGSTSEQFVKEALGSVQLTPAIDYDEAVNLVINGDVDALVADLPICVISTLRNPGADLLTVTSPFTFEPLGIALPPDDPLFLNLVENYMHLLEGTGLMEQLEAKWFLDGSWLAELP